MRNFLLYITVVYCCVTGPRPDTDSVSDRPKLSGSGSGTYYYDIDGKSCFGEVFGYENGYTSCESYTPGKNQKTLQERDSNYIVAIDVAKLNNPKGRKKYCGKRLNVKHNGVLVNKTFVVWDGCGSCKSKKIDFSLSALKAINKDACFLGVVPGLTWEITNEQVMKFVP
jgi:hypothetical protein